MKSEFEDTEANILNETFTRNSKYLIIILIPECRKAMAGSSGFHQTFHHVSHYIVTVLLGNNYLFNMMVQAI